LTRTARNLTNYYVFSYWWLFLSQQIKNFRRVTTFQLIKYFKALESILGVVSLSTDALFRALSYYSKIFKCIQSLNRRSNAKSNLLTNQCFTPSKLKNLNAFLKKISQNASYRRVWLAFHSNPEFTQVFCNKHWLGPHIYIW
jgi:hypothetical protein